MNELALHVMNIFLAFLLDEHIYTLRPRLAGGYFQQNVISLVYFYITR